MAEREPELKSSENDEQNLQSDSAESVEEHSLRAMLDTARDEADQQRKAAEEYLKMLQRVQADFVNYKRRVEAERETKADSVRAETIRMFLPLVDDFERALAHLPPDALEQSWAQGFGLIERNLAALFDGLGVRRVGVEGEVFDPNIHEAVAYEEHPTHPEGHVAAVVRPGYQLGDRVVRPAQVSVARAAAESEQSENNKWPRHQAWRGAGNGGVEPADLRQPRNIERA